MKIIITTTESTSEYGGLGRHNHEIKKRLMKWGHEIKEINLNITSGNNKASYKMSTSRFFQNFQKIYPQSFKYDLVLAQGHWAGLYLYRHKRIAHKPIVTILHSLEKDRPLRANFLGFTYYLSRMLEYMTVFNSDHILVSSNYMRQRFMNHYPNFKKKISFIGNGVDNSFLNCNYRNVNFQNNVISVIGRLEPEKGILQFLDDFELLLMKDPSFHCRIIGKCRDIYKKYKLDILRKICKSRLLNNSTSIHPFITDTQRLISKIKESLAVVVPSTYEPFGLIALETMATGTPVVANNVGGIPEYIENKKNSILYNDSLEFVESLLKLKSDEKFRALISANAHESAKCLSWDTVARNIITTYGQYV